MSPSERAWLYVPGNEQTLRLPVSRRFTNRNDLIPEQARLPVAFRWLLFTLRPRGFFYGPSTIGLQKYYFFFENSWCNTNGPTTFTFF